MNICIVGAGLMGCTLGYLLSERGHKITIYESEKQIGGLCKTMYLNGLKYEHSGHIFHTNNKKIVDFIKRFCKIRRFKHYVGAKINNSGRIYPFPICERTIEEHPQKKQILKEINNSPKIPRKDNFEVASIDMMGKTLYNQFVKRYTKKMWNKDPKELPAEMAIKRISPNKKDESYFKEKYQFYPLPDFNYLFKKMTEKCKIIFTSDVGIYGDVDFSWFKYNKDFDLIITTGKMDVFLNEDMFRMKSYFFPLLEYTGINVVPYIKNEKNVNGNYGTINYPNHSNLLRITEYKKINGQVSDNSLITKEYPFYKGDQYPITTERNEVLFKRYLFELCKHYKNVITFGRLGLYKYLNMDECIELCLNNLDFIENYLKMIPIEKYNKYMELRK